ncbi:MAG: protease inhibitor I42 family protein [Methanoregulaceae archaeon]|nr:protease inhibitor I42 family protein [Methanoregulaceae archaeon]
MEKYTLVVAGIMLLCIAAVFACGCTNPAKPPEPAVTPTPTQTPGAVYRFDQTNNNETFSIGLDSEIQLQLPGNPTTGYSWQLDITQGIVIENESFIPDDKSGTLAGSGGTYVWTMRAVQPGNQVISGVYARAWESNRTNPVTFTLTLNVGEVLTPPGVPSPVNVYTEADSGQTVNESRGDRFNVRLAENPTTGYGWNVTSSPGLELILDEYIPSYQSGQVVGSGGIHSFSFNAVDSGIQTLHGEYRRDWVMAGTIVFVNLEGGFYGIRGDDGRDYYPLAMDEQYRKDGLRVAFDYETVKDTATIQMWGTPVNLTFIETIETFDLSVIVT